MAFADKREYAYWLDQSGNNNDWTSNNLTESDISVDSPTNNFATMNPLVKHTNVDTTYSEGNLKIYKAATYWTSTLATMYMDSGKWYAEFCCLTDGVYMIFGINAEGDLYANHHPGADSSGYGYGYVFDTGSGRGDITYQGSNSAYTGGAFNNLAVGTIIGITLDFDNNQVKFYANNVLQYTQTIGARPYTYSLAPHGGYIVSNFGQDSSFAGNKTAQGNQDSGSIGDFYYTPPTGFKALCTSNLPAVAVIPSEHFNTVAYTGTGANQVVTGVGFQPDFLWFKNRSLGYGYILLDTVRGLGAPLASESSDAEYAFSYVSSVSNDGFTTASSQYPTNNTGSAIVAWNWKANGSGSSNTDGSITSTVSVNTDAGFSIVSYTGTGSAATIGHGLSKKPEMILVKRRDDTAGWRVFHDANAANYHLVLDTTGARASSSSIFNNTEPTASLFTVGAGGSTNESSGTFIAYCFHSVDGYSKVGSYTGNGSTTNGPFVYTGFRPAFIMVKRTNAAGHWEIHDTARDVNNPSGLRLMPNYTSAESSSGAWDIVSNGFKVNTDHDSINNSGSPMIYLAFAETPFKYSNAR
jgi:hypothetical protein